MLHSNLQKNGASLINRKGLLHDNARLYIAQVTQEKIMALIIGVFA